MVTISEVLNLMISSSMLVIALIGLLVTILFLKEKK